MLTSLTQQDISQLTFLFSELMEETGFSHTHITNDDVFKDIRVVVRSRCHDCYFTCQHIDGSTNEYLSKAEILIILNYTFSVFIYHRFIFIISFF